MSQQPDATLVSRMLEEHGAALALYAAQWTADPDDCVQEALVELARQAKPPRSPVAWLYQVVKRKALTAARTAGRRQQREREWFRRRLSAPAEGLDAFDSAALIELLSRLADDRREVVVLRLWGGLTFEEIGRVVSVSTASAQRRYEQALAQLRKAWSPPCPKNPKEKTAAKGKTA